MYGQHRRFKLEKNNSLKVHAEVLFRPQALELCTGWLMWLSYGSSGV